jgi:hypothetical protein
VPNIYSCPSCAAVIVPQEAGEFCPKCRTPLPQSAIETVMPQDIPGVDDATRLAPGTGPTPSTPGSGLHERRSHSPSSKDSRPSSSTGWLSSSGAIDHGRFEPGALLGGRYRIIERLGRGGMGEVYRADDLKLGQPVALKFLPPDVDRDPARLTQLHTEVRMARQVSHPDVCRVYDIDEIDGTTFLSMVSSKRHRARRTAGTCCGRSVPRRSFSGTARALSCSSPGDRSIRSDVPIHPSLPPA